MDNQIKTFWLINQYASTPQTGMGGRHYYFAKELARKGHKVYLITGSYSHLLRLKDREVIDAFTSSEVNGFSYIEVKVSRYRNARSLKRIFNWFAFSWRLLRLNYFINDRPDYILYSSPSLIPYLGAYYLSRKFKVPLIWDIRDLWPLTLMKLGGMTKYNIFVVVHKLIELFAYKNSDYIVSNWPYANRYLEGLGNKKLKFLFLPNGYMEEEFDNPKMLDQYVKDQIPKEKFIVGYAGTLGKANAVNVIAEVALALRQNTEVHIVLVGDGDGVSYLNDYIKDHNLLNITIINSIEKLQIPSLLSNFDVCYVGFNKSDLYEYGSSLNKLPEYLMSGNPIIFSIDSPFKPVFEASCGFHVAAEDVDGIVTAIFELKSMTLSERKILGLNGKSYAVKNYRYAHLSQKLVNFLEEQ